MPGRIIQVHVALSCDTMTLLFVALVIRLKIKIMEMWRLYLHSVTTKGIIGVRTHTRHCFCLKPTCSSSACRRRSLYQLPPEPQSLPVCLSVRDAVSGKKSIHFTFVQNPDSASQPTQFLPFKPFASLCSAPAAPLTPTTPSPLLSNLTSFIH